MKTIGYVLVKKDDKIYEKYLKHSNNFLVCFSGVFEFYKKNGQYVLNNGGIYCPISKDMRTVYILYNGELLRMGKILELSSKPFRQSDTYVDEYKKIKKKIECHNVEILKLLDDKNKILTNTIRNRKKHK